MANGLFGSQQTADTASEWNMLAFIVQSMMRGMATATLVKVTAVTNDGGVAPVGFVDLQPQVNLLDGAGVAVPHGTIYHCPYMRIQGGANAVILDPQVGDIGIAVFADRDISSVMANRGQANPGSRRRFDMADAMYLGAWSATVPEQYVRFSVDGIEIVSPTKVKLAAPDVDIECTVLEINATSSVTITTPTFTVNGDTTNNGAVHTTGASTVDGVLTANGDAALNATLSVTGIANFSGGVFDGSTSIGAAHQHHYDGHSSGTWTTSGVI